MTETRSTPEDAAHAEYRRHARRIRCVFASDPESRMRALHELAQLVDAKRTNAISPEPVMSLPCGAAQTFANLVRERIDGPVLRYSHRARLIREAERRGIARFEANLIIAAVQHQAGVVSAASRSGEEPRRGGWASAGVGLAATQSLIAIAVWWVIG